VPQTPRDLVPGQKQAEQRQRKANTRGSASGGVGNVQQRSDTPRLDRLRNILRQHLRIGAALQSAKRP